MKFKPSAALYSSFFYKMNSYSAGKPCVNNLRISDSCFRFARLISSFKRQVIHIQTKLTVAGFITLEVHCPYILYRLDMLESL